MQCPVDNTTLVMTERAGVEIDYCPKCRGVWLDRGELDKIISKSSDSYAGDTPARGHDEREYREDRGHDDHEHRGDDEYRGHGDKNGYDQHGNKKRRGSLMEDLFGGFGD
jgi:Zn-finger nucleic acid-binding protein